MSTQNPLQTTFPIWPCGESQGAAIPNPEKGIVAKWNNYFGKNVNDLAKWKQLCSDLDKSADTFTTKTQCQKAHTPDYAWALKDVWVHTHDFLAAENKPDDVVFFTSECDLTTYTQKSAPPPSAFRAITSCEEARCVTSWLTCYMLEVASIDGRHMMGVVKPLLIVGDWVVESDPRPLT